MGYRVRESAVNPSYLPSSTFTHYNTSDKLLNLLILCKIRNVKIASLSLSCCVNQIKKKKKHLSKMVGPVLACESQLTSAVITHVLINFSRFSFIILIILFPFNLYFSMNCKFYKDKHLFYLVNYLDTEIKNNPQYTERIQRILLKLILFLSESFQNTSKTSLMLNHIIYNDNDLHPPVPRHHTTSGFMIKLN